MTQATDDQFRYEHRVLTEAIRVAKLLRRKPDEGDRVPATREPMTKAQRIALDLSRGKRQPPAGVDGVIPWLLAFVFAVFIGLTVLDLVLNGRG